MSSVCRSAVVQQIPKILNYKLIYLLFAWPAGGDIVHLKRLQLLSCSLVGLNVSMYISSINETIGIKSPTLIYLCHFLICLKLST